MSWHEARQAWCRHQAQRGLSPRTVEMRDYWLSYFESFCLQNGLHQVSQVTTTTVARYRDELGRGRAKQSGKPLRQVTMDGALEAVRLFLRWAVAAGLLLVDPTVGLLIRRRPLTNRGVLDTQDVDQLVATADTTSLLGIRDRTLVELFYGTGIRLRECYCLDVDDVDLAARTLLVREGKGAKQRLLPLGDHLCHILSEYILQSRSKLLQTHDERAFFLDMYGKRMAYANFGSRLRKMSRQSLGRPLGPHALRHAMATHLLEGGADIREVQVLLGHEHISSTEVYTHLRDKARTQTYRDTHPRANWQPPEP